MQFHIRVLESAPDTVALLLAGLEYLINISYVDDTEVFKVCKLLLIQLHIYFPLSDSFIGFARHLKMTIFSCVWIEQVCLDYWNTLVLELFDAHHNSDNPAASINLMGLQVGWIP